jgi:energy-converting hydrogenase Eha subunit H
VKFAAAVAVVFGVVTLVAGGRVLLGADPGYTVYRPLLLFNTAMGLAYVAVGVLAWRRSAFGVTGAALVALANLAVLGGIAMLYAPGGPVAVNSLQAMAFRTVVWVAIVLVLLWAGRRGEAR